MGHRRGVWWSYSFDMAGCSVQREAGLCLTSLFLPSPGAVFEICLGNSPLLGVDQRRLVPHCLRYGVVVAMVSNGFDRDAQVLRGGWLAESGPVSYWRQTGAAAKRAATAIYDESSGRAEELVGLYASAEHAVSVSRKVACLRA